MSQPATTAGAPRGVVEEFRTEFAGVWRRVPNKDLFLILFAAVLVLFHFYGNATFGYVRTASLFGWLYNAYTAPLSEDGHGPLIPVVVLALFWLKRKDLLALPLRSWWPGLILFGAALGLHVLGYLVQQPKVSVIALILGLWGLMGLAWGPALLSKSVFPYCFMVFLVPLGNYAEAVTFPLRILVSWISVFITRTILGFDVIREGALISNSLHTLQLEVAPACSGIRSLVALLALTTICAVVVFQRPWKRVVVALLAVPLAILGNVLRITTVVIVGSLGSQQSATMIEQKLGYLTFIVAFLGLWMAIRFLSEPGSPAQASLAKPKS